MLRRLAERSARHKIRNRAAGALLIQATNVQQVYSNRQTKSSLTGYNETTKTNRLIERMIERTKMNRERNESNRTTNRIWIEYKNIDNNNAFNLAAFHSRDSVLIPREPKTESYRRNLGRGANIMSFQACIRTYTCKMLLNTFIFLNV